MNILRGLHTNQKWEYLTSPNKRECLGRELCLRSLKSHQNDEGTHTGGPPLTRFSGLRKTRVKRNSR